MKELGIATNKKILDLYNMMKDGSLTLKPSFQRKLVWNSKHKENFIDTILKDYLFLKYIFQLVKLILNQKNPRH